MNILKKVYKILSPRERRWGYLVLVLMVFTAFLEMVGVAAIFPFLSVLSDPSMIERNRVLFGIYELLGFSSAESFLFFLGSCAFGLVLLSAIVRSVNLYALNRYTYMRKHSIGARLLETYLRQPYTFYLNRHTSDLAKSILSEVNFVIKQVYQPAAVLIAQGLTAIAIVGLLVAVDPIVALVVAATMGTIYAVIFMRFRPVVARMGQLRVKANRQQYEVAAEVLGGIKDIKVLGREKTYSKRFFDASKRDADYQASVATLSQIPRFALEAIAFGGIILLTLVLVYRAGGVQGEALGQVVPLIGLYAFAGYKMLPAIQGIYNGLTQLRFGAAAIDSLYADITASQDLPDLQHRPSEPLPLGTGLRLEGVSFLYPGGSGAGVQDISLTIPAGSSVGIVGSTGAGKTTLVDLILGLLEPTSGQRFAGGVEITRANLRAWQANIGYVPQSIFLADATIAENIALGVPPERIDRQRVQDCARMAQIHDFIMSLPEGYETGTGERGVRLSGGQRQRIGIARALYSDPELIVFDEATSALDNVTEHEVMAAIEALAGKKTIIMIAHRLSTVEHCDKIVVMEKGRIVGEGDFGSLVRSHKMFPGIDVRRDGSEAAVARI